MDQPLIQNSFHKTDCHDHKLDSKIGRLNKVANFLGLAAKFSDSVIPSPAISFPDKVRFCKERGCLFPASFAMPLPQAFPELPSYARIPGSSLSQRLYANGQSMNTNTIKCSNCKSPSIQEIHWHFAEHTVGLARKHS